MSRFTPHLGCLLALLALLHAAPAAASDTYPAEVQKSLGLAEIAGTPPGCTLCHKNDDGGVKTVIRPFGRSLMLAGAQGANIQSLRAALKAVESQGVDSDQDGVGDIDELRAGTDPNVGSAGGAGGGFEDPYADIPLPETGCSLAPGNLGSQAAGLGFLAALMLLLRRRRG